MRRRSKSVFVGAEVAHYFNSKSFGAEKESIDTDEENEVNKMSKNSAMLSDHSNAEGNYFDDLDAVLFLIQEVYGHIPANDNLPFEERLNLIDWSLLKFQNAKKQIFDVIESERKHRLLHEILDDAHKRAIRNLNIKRPSPYIGLYISENKDALKKIMIKTGNKNMITTANEEFKKLSEKERQSYLQKANCAKGNYINEMKKYTLTFKKGGSNKERKLTPFVLFKQHEHLKGDVGPRSELIKRYNDLPYNKKIIWILRYLGVNQGDKLSYDQFIKAKETLNKDEIQLIEDYEGKPKKTVPYNLFVKEFFKNSKNKDHKLAMKECAMAWKAMPIEGKAKYQAQHSKCEWEKKMFEYLNDLPEERRNLEIDSNSKLSRKAFEKMFKTYGNSNYSIKNEINSKDNRSNPPSQKKNKEQNEYNIGSKKTKKNTTELFFKFEDDEEIQTSQIFEPTNSTLKRDNKSKLFLKFNDDENESIKVNESSEMPMPISIKTENDKKRKNVDISFPKPIKMELETDSDGSKSKKKKKFADDSFGEFCSNHNSTEITASPKKKKKKARQDFTSENEGALKPPKTVLKYFTQSVHKGPSSTAKSAFQELSAKEKNKITTAFKKAQVNFLSEFEKRIQGMSSKELSKFARIHESSSNRDENDEDSD
ncbi:UBTF family protein [Megaselia abdita]